MKKFVIILQVLISLFVLRCKAQPQDFVEYLSNFRDINLPFKIIDSETFSAIFLPNDSIPEIKNKDFVKKFVYNNSVNSSLLSSADYRYEYGVKYELNGKFVVLVKRQTYEGTTEDDFDLAEIIVVIYSPTGKFLSSQAISKDNDDWLSYVYFLEKDKIVVHQIKILEFNKPEMDCEIEMIAYKIDSNGIIQKNTLRKNIKGLVVWDKEKNELKLKQMIIPKL